MTEPNPYNPPTIPASQKSTTSTTKKAIGFVAILFLTPFAVFLTGFVSCLAVEPVMDGIDKMQIVRGEDGLVISIIFGFTFVFLPPIIVFGLMLRWAILAYRRASKEKIAGANSDDTVEQPK